MTQLRDARLQQALDHAPDAHMAPDARTRQAILQQAAAAVAPPAKARRPWWRVLWPELGAGRMPWNAAFATVLLASFVTLLWQGQPVPDAQPDEAVRAKPAAAPSPVPPQVVAPQDASPAPQAAAPRAGPPPAPSAGSRSNVPVARPRAREEAADAALAKKNEAVVPPPASKEAPPAVAAAPAPAPMPAPQAFPASPSAPAPVPAPAQAPAPSAAAAAAPPAAERSESAVAGRAMAPADRAIAAQSAPAPAPAPIASPAPAARAGVADAPAIAGWTTLRIETLHDGRQRYLSRAEAVALAALVRRIAPTAGLDATVMDAITLRLVFLQGDEVLAVLDVAPSGDVRWTQQRAGFAGRWSARASEASLDALRAELRRFGVAL